MNGNCFRKREGKKAYLAMCRSILAPLSLKNPTAFTTPALSILEMGMLIGLKADDQMKRRAG